MAETYQGINCYDGPIGMNAQGVMVSGTIMVPENIPHYYKELPPGGPNKTILQVITAGVDSQGNQPPEPPKQYRAPTYHSATKPPSGEAAPLSLGIQLIQAGLAILRKG
jgi:hypothetical protein